jgi:hypothetical protein
MFLLTVNEAKSRSYSPKIENNENLLKLLVNDYTLMIFMLFKGLRRRSLDPCTPLHDSLWLRPYMMSRSRGRRGRGSRILF